MGMLSIHQPRWPWVSIGKWTKESGELTESFAKIMGCPYHRLSNKKQFTKSKKQCSNQRMRISIAVVDQKGHSISRQLPSPKWESHLLILWVSPLSKFKRIGKNWHLSKGWDITLSSQSFASPQWKQPPTKSIREMSQGREMRWPSESLNLIKFKR